MAFSIEIITTEKDLIKQIGLAIQPLNTVQAEFSYRVASQRLLEQTYYFKKDDYTLSEVFVWLRQFRIDARGNRPFIILITAAGLSGQKSNLYGAHKGKEGLAVFTTDVFEPEYKQFLFDKVRFIRYFLVRYALSFVTPETSTHKSDGCMFDEKNDKKDIKLSLNTGNLCSVCEKELKESPLCNIEVEAALNRMRQVVSNAYPRALVLKGGGVKGLALVGAMLELEKYFVFKTFAGTSAGAIAATLLGAGYEPSELEVIFRVKKFKTFTDNYFKVICNLLTGFFLHSGDHIQVWLNELLSKKINNQVREVKMRNLPRRTIIYASRTGDGFVPFDSEGENRDENAAFATRCSMSIPFFFKPKKTSDKKTYDGGLGNNFPLRTFLEDNRDALFIGLYLKSKIRQNGRLLGNLIDIATDANERTIVDQNIEKIVIIDPSPVKTTQFSLSEKEKEFLVLTGRLGALEYLHKYHEDFQITLEQVKEVEDQVEALRKEIGLSRWRRFKRRFSRKKMAFE